MTQISIYNLGEIASKLGLELIGDNLCQISGIGTLLNAVSGELSFLSNPSYRSQLNKTKASAVIVEERYAKFCPTNALISENPYLSFADATHLFKPSFNRYIGIHESAVIAESAYIDSTVSIGPNVVVEENASIARGSVIGPNCYVGESVTIGENCHLQNNVSLYYKVRLGNSVTIQSGSVIGADGFGFAFDGEKQIKIHQLGSVLLGDHVEIGACTTIDRGTIDDTIIGKGVKIDNQVQIGHNCKVGDHSIICGCVGIAGSVNIGKYCIMGGASGAVGHITISDKVNVTAMSLVSESILEPGTYSSGTWHMKTLDWKRSSVRFKQLDEMNKRVRQLERKFQSDDDETSPN